MTSSLLIRRLARSSVSATPGALRLALTTALIVALAAPAVAAPPPAVTDNFALDAPRRPARDAKEGVRALQSNAVATASMPQTSDESAGRVIVGFSAVSESTAMNSARAMGAKLKRRAKTGSFAVMTVPPGKSAQGFATALAKRPGVTYAEPDGIVRALLTPNDPGFANQWGPKKIGAPAAWDVTRGSSAVKIAIIDSGVKLNHPDLVGRLDTKNDYDFVHHDKTADDEDGHGTHVAGIVGATMNNSTGIAGIADQCVILPLKVLGADGTGYDSDVADAIRLAADKGSQVINLSLSSSGYSITIANAVNYAVARDCLVVAAAGNESISSVSFPALLDNVFAVGSSTSTDALSAFSSWGPQIDVVAPGSGIYSTVYSGGYGYMSGTSMAAPHVAGLAGLLRSQFPSWTRTMVEQRIRDTAVDLGAAGKDDRFGHGRIDAAAAMSAPIPPPPISTGDDDIPGVPLPTSPVTGSLEKGTDDSDVYAVALAAGDTLSVSLTGEANTDFDLYLYPPGASKIGAGQVAASEKPTYPDEFEYRAPRGGTYYLEVYAYSGTGPYAVTYSINPATTAADDDIPGVTLPASPITDTLHVQSDPNDVYSIELEAGQSFSVNLSGAAGTDFDVHLYAPGADSVSVDQPLRAADGVAYPNRFTYAAPTTGTYYLGVYAFSGSGTYQLAWNVRPTEDNDNIPGVPLPDGPVVDSLDAEGDHDDVYQVDLVAGQWLYLELEGPSTADFDLYLFGPDATSVYTSAPIARSTGGDSQEIILYRAQVTGTHYVDIYAYSGAGSYTLTHGRPAKQPTLTLAVPSPITYAATVAAKGTLRNDLGAAMPSQWIHLYQRPVGSSTWSYVTSALTGSTGAYSFSVKPSKRTTYRTWYIGNEVYINTFSPEKTIIPRVSMGNVKASKTMYVKKARTAYGYIKPRHTSGTYPVRIYRYRYESGKWRSYGYVRAKATNYSTYSKYAVSLKLSKKGRWRLRAYHPADTQHAATWSSKFTHVTVK